MRRRRLPWLFAAAALIGGPAAAHTVWLSPAPGDAGSWRVLFGGHAGKVEAYQPAKLTAVRALDAAGKRLAVRRSAAAEGVRLSIAGKPSLILADYDNGIHTRRSDGPSVEKPMNEVPTAISAVWAVKHHKTIVAWTPVVAKPAGQPFEVVPVSAAQPRGGQPMQVRVLIDGKPAAGIKIARNEEGQDAVSDARGLATFTPAKGFNKLWAGRRTAVKGEPRYSQLSIEYSLGFDAL